MTINNKILLCFFLLGVTYKVCAAENRLVLTGASTVAPLALEIGKRFEKYNPGIRIDVQSGGSSRGIRDTRSGAADIGMVSRDLKDDEKDLVPHLIAHDGVCIILHKDNPVHSLTDAQITAIYTGKIVNWKELGGRDSRITVVNKAEGRSTLELFLHYFSITNSQIKAQVVVGENQQGIKTVAGNPGAIGYVSVGSAEFEAANGAALRLLPMKNIAATTESVRTGKFPLARPLNFVTKGQPTSLAKRFIEFAQSNKTDDLIRSQFFVPVAH